VDQILPSDPYPERIAKTFWDTQAAFVEMPGRSGDALISCMSVYHRLKTWMPVIHLVSHRGTRPRVLSVDHSG
jgi:hypothetical protein